MTPLSASPIALPSFVQYRVRNRTLTPYLKSRERVVLGGVFDPLAEKVLTLRLCVYADMRAIRDTHAPANISARKAHERRTACISMLLAGT